MQHPITPNCLCLVIGTKYRELNNQIVTALYQMTPGQRWISAKGKDYAATGTAAWLCRLQRVLKDLDPLSGSPEVPILARYLVPLPGPDEDGGDDASLALFIPVPDMEQAAAS